MFSTNSSINNIISIEKFSLTDFSVYVILNKSYYHKDVILSGHNLFIVVHLFL